MSSITRWVLAHKRIVTVFWIVLTLIGMASANSATKAMTQKFSVPGKEGWETNVAIKEHFGGTGGDAAPIVPVVALRSGESVTSPGIPAQLTQLDSRLQRALPGARIASFASTGSRSFLSADGRTTFAIVYPRPELGSQFGENPGAAKAAVAAVRGFTVGGAPVRVSGYDALQNESGQGSGTGVLLEAMLGGIGALVILAFVFASFLAVIPIVMAIVSIMTTFLLVWALTTVTEISPVVEFLIALVGLGVAIDYSLLVVSRWREERAHGRSGEEAVQRAMETAGRAVVFSGTTVAIGLVAMIALPVPFLRSIGYAGMLIPLVSTLVAITLLPVVLAKLGPRLDWPHRRTDDRASRAWTRWAEGVVRHRWLATGSAIAILAALVIAATGLSLGEASPNSIARHGEAKVGLDALDNSGIGPGSILPNEILSRGRSADRVAAQLSQVEGIHGAVAPDSPHWRREGLADVLAFPTADVSTSAGRGTLDRVRSAAHAAGPEVRVGGLPAQNADFISAVYGGFPLMIALIAGITFILLARAFRSLLLPAKAVVLNVLSVTAAWGVLAVVWQNGHGSTLLWGIEATGSVPAWIPLMIFAFLFGLSMDYEVFILSRMREEYDRTGDTRQAVIGGIGRTGRLVTSAALILFLSFVSLASGPGTDLKMFATGLAAGILLDATVIRALLVPAVVSLFGRWNWILPRRPAKMLRVEPSLPPRALAASEEAS
ncbi:MAG TPA: MMPL family transporter [Solirubrobacterales bacterium]|nr:MMPL family transporter [Solirubrobacterales bacterium]